MQRPALPISTVVVADDDGDICELLRTRLRMAGYTVQVARNGKDALRHILYCPPDGVVLDINMPELDGFGVLRAMRENARTSRTPVLMLTARHAEQDVRRAMQLGARDYLTKPFTEQQLVARVARLLRAPFVLPPSTARPSGSRAEA